MSTDCFKYQVSVKFGEYDNAMLNIRADTEGELLDACKVVNKLAGDVALAAEVLRAVAVGGSGVAASLAANGNLATPPAPAPAAQAAPAANQGNTSAYMCAHGARVKKSGQNTDGAWEGWFCPLDKTHPERCKPMYPGR